MFVKNRSTIDLFILGLMSLTLFVILMISSTIKPYGYFIDELYFLACSKRLAFGYVDQPPLSLVLLALMQKLFGSSMFVVRLLPALCISATVFVTGLTARQLGGSLASMLLAGLGVMVMPVMLVFGSFYSMNAFEPLIWTTVVLFVVKMIQEDNPKYWLQIGFLMGLGLEMKHTIVLYGVALVIGFLLSDKRKLLFNRWILWGGLVCFILILPNLLWQYENHFPSLELYSNSYSSKNIDKPYPLVLIEQIVFVNPVNFLLWFGGLIVLLTPWGKPYRLMLFAYAFLLLVILAGHSSRPDRIASIYTFFMAAGAVAIEQIPKTYWKRFALIFLGIQMVTGGILLTPAFCPILPPQTLKPYLASLGLHFNIEENKKDEPIPQWLADRLGWHQLAAEVAVVYHALPENEKQNAVIISTNYGEAGALELYGPEFRLPPVYATHNSFHSWGPPSDSVRTYIGVMIDIDDVRSRFESVQDAKVFHCMDCTKPQRNIPIYILRGPKFSVEKAWPEFKNYH